MNLILKWIEKRIPDATMEVMRKQKECIAKLEAELDTWIDRHGKQDVEIERLDEQLQQAQTESERWQESYDMRCRQLQQARAEIIKRDTEDPEYITYCQAIEKDLEQAQAEIDTIRAWGFKPEASAVTLGEAIMELQDDLHQSRQREARLRGVIRDFWNNSMQALKEE